MTGRARPGNDQLFGFEGNDQLAGGAATTCLRGGARQWTSSSAAPAADFFVLDFKAQRRTNVDVLYDFNAAEDTIQLVKGVFAKVASKKGVLVEGRVLGRRSRCTIWPTAFFTTRRPAGSFYDR